MPHLNHQQIMLIQSLKICPEPNYFSLWAATQVPENITSCKEYFSSSLSQCSPARLQAIHHAIGKASLQNISQIVPHISLTPSRGFLSHRKPNPKSLIRSTELLKTWPLAASGLFHSLQTTQAFLHSVDKTSMKGRAFELVASSASCSPHSGIRIPHGLTAFAHMSHQGDLSHVSYIKQHSALHGPITLCSLHFSLLLISS